MYIYVPLYAAESAHDAMMDATAKAASHALASLMQDWNGNASDRRSQQVLLRIASDLVDADPRVAKSEPPAHVTDVAAYHKRRARVLKSLLVEATIAYYISSGEPMTHLPVPPPHTADDL